MQPDCLDRNTTDRYIYPSGSLEVIETNMASKYFYEFMSDLTFHFSELLNDKIDIIIFLTNILEKYGPLKHAHRRSRAV